MKHTFTKEAIKFTLLLLLFSSVSVCVAQTQTKLSFDPSPSGKDINIKLYLEKGYSESPSAEPCEILWESTDNTHSLLAKELLKDWSQLKIGRILLNPIQYVYQEVQEGNFPEQNYNLLLDHFQIKIDTAYLSEKPIKHSVMIASGQDSEGKEMILIDTDGDGFLTNEVAIALEKYDQAEGMSKDDILKKAKYVTYERYVNSKVITEVLPIVIFYYSALNRIECKTAQSLKATFQQDGLTYKLALSFSNKFDSELTLINPKDVRGKLNCKKGELVLIGDKLYRYKGFNYLTRELHLEQVTNINEIVSTQVGLAAIPLKGKEFTTGEELSLASFKGKYVFIDFWGTWCKPCLAAMPALSKAYNELDKDKFAILGIVTDHPDALKKYLDINNVPWPQILSDSENKITEAYNVNAYPTTFLLDPEGKIIARDLGGEDAIKMVSELIKN